MLIMCCRIAPRLRQNLRFVSCLVLFGAWLHLPGTGFAQENSGKIQIAVLDVVPKGQVEKDLPDILGLLISAHLSQSGAFDVITQEDVRQMIGFEKMKSTLGCELDESCLAEIGAALGVPYLLTSQVAKVGTTYILSMSLIDINAAKGISRDSIKAKNQDQLIADLEPRLDRLVAGLRYAQGGQMAIICPELGALVEVDGRALGVTPLPVQDLPAGPHRVVVTKEGFFRFTRDVDLIPGDALQVEIQLQSVSGTTRATDTPKTEATSAPKSTSEATPEKESSGSIFTSPFFYVGLVGMSVGGVTGLGGTAVGVYYLMQVMDTSAKPAVREAARMPVFAGTGLAIVGTAILLVGAGVTATSLFLE
jgi:hypothetical protein